jgi:hypothetical protein
VSFLVHVIEFLLIVSLVGAAALAVAFVLGRRWVCRRWHLVRGHVIWRWVLAGFALAAAGRERYWARATPDELSSGSSARVRRRMWVAIEDAETAVAHASSHEAPVADLPSVCRSLRGVADELDGLLRLERRLPRGTPRADTLRTQVADLIGAARDVQAAALQAGSEAAEPQIRALVRRAGEEVDLVATALSRLRSVAPPH